ncbi:lipase [Hoyosella rhizosphaerae]|uniref:Lipase n=1 Tax=Hoyosella rhizosphaerae TaxID=1755582 RepID=A0A916U3C2_9ACTN|nr:lipase [Hoyosella rhizosphaerae]
MIAVCSAGLVSAGLVTAQVSLATAEPTSSTQPGANGHSITIPIVHGPAQNSPIKAKHFDRSNPGRAPHGANDPACTSTSSYPILLAHGTDATAYTDFAYLAPELRKRGYCVFALNYGVGKPGINLSPSTGVDAPTFGTKDIRKSAREVADAVTRIRATTGANKVHLIGFSQGANVTRYYVNKLGGASVVDAWVGIASPTYGSDAFSPILRIPGGEELAANVLAPALIQQISGSSFLHELNWPTDTVPGVRYTTISTDFDEVISPVTNIPLRGESQHFSLQSVCPYDMSGHFQLSFNPVVLELTLHALNPEHIPVVECRFVPPGVGLIDTFIASNS